MFTFFKKRKQQVVSSQATKQEQKAARVAKLRELQLELLDRVSGGNCGKYQCF